MSQSWRSQLPDGYLEPAKPHLDCRTDRIVRMDNGNIDPVHQHNDGQWWFWDETWADEYGPFNDYEAAEISLEQYAEVFLG